MIVKLNILLSKSREKTISFLDAEAIVYDEEFRKLAILLTNDGYYSTERLSINQYNNIVDGLSITNGYVDLSYTNLVFLRNLPGG